MTRNVVILAGYFTANYADIMKRFSPYFTIFMFLLGLSVEAQVTKLSEDPVQFIADVQKMMATSGNPNYVKAAKNLETLWLDSRLTQGYQKSIVTLTKRMIAKGYKPTTPHFEQFFNGIYAAFNGTYASPNEVEGYLNTAAQIVETYDTKSVLKYFETARNLFDNRLLYVSNFNRLFALEGTFSFRFSDANAELAKTAEPAKANATNDGWGNVLTDSTGLTSTTFYEKKPLPNIAGAIIEFKNVNLVMVTANDSVPLTQTNGKLAIREGIWVGTGGKMTWETVGNPEIYVAFNAYSFNISLPKLMADDAKLHYETKLAQPVEGAFEYESKRRNKGQISPYPKFVSYRNDAQLRGLSKNIRYQGGLSLVGLKLSSTSLSQEPSTITVNYNGKIAFKSTSRRFELTDSLVTSPLASFSTYLGTDSLYHPGVRLSYSDSEGLVKTQPADGSGFQYTPYADSYHKMYIEAELLRWSFVKNQIEFSVISGKTVVPIRFESFNFFKSERFRAMSEQYGFHPLLMAANYVAKQKTPTFAPEEIAQFYKRDMNAVRAAFNQMYFDGYVAIDPKNGLFRLTNKGLLYVLANNKQTDFDNFRVSSLYPANTTTANASIDLKDNVLTIRGVDKFTISDSLKIAAIPSDKQIKVFKNRDFSMNGLLTSANFRFNGRDLVFNYDKFFVDLNKIDNITFIPKSAYDKGSTTEVGGDIVYEKSGEFTSTTLLTNRAQRKFHFPPFKRTRRNDGVF